jgi:hypothetical protein
MPYIPPYCNNPPLPLSFRLTVIYDGTDIQVILLHKTPIVLPRPNQSAHPPPRSVASLVADANRLRVLRHTARLALGRHSAQLVRRATHRTSRQPSDHHRCDNRTLRERRQERQDIPRRATQSGNLPSISAIDNLSTYTDLNAYNALFAQDHLYALDSLTALNSSLPPNSIREATAGTSLSVEVNDTQSRGVETVAPAGEWDFLLKGESSA